MIFISYAQNFEDVMLWRALKHIENGFYIDVGANDPFKDSVTKSFYDHGWHGINIEPLPLHHATLKENRTRDINLQCAAGAEEGEFNIWETDVRGWATMEPEVVKQHEKNGHIGTWHKISVLPLSAICGKYVSNEIHFLKIDVEGFELEVLKGINFNITRPWILIIEATAPASMLENYDLWENKVLSAGYIFAYADGLNRFYVSKEHSELLSFFKYPPNVFDEFISDQVIQLSEQAKKSQELAQLAQRQLDDLYSSTSWFITKPLRWIESRLNELFRGNKKAEVNKAEDLKDY